MRAVAEVGGHHEHHLGGEGEEGGGVAGTDMLPAMLLGGGGLVVGTWGWRDLGLAGLGTSAHVLAYIFWVQIFEKGVSITSMTV